MSESTPKIKTTPKSEGGAETASPSLGLNSYKRESKDALWTLVSIVVHAVVIGGLLLFTFTRTPIEELLNRKKEHTVAKERIEKMSEQIRDINKEELQKNVITLLGIKASMEAITDTRNAAYEQFSYAMRQQKPREAQDSVKEVLQILPQSEKILMEIEPLQKKIISYGVDSSAFTPEQKKVVDRYNAIREELSQSNPLCESKQEAAYFTIAWLGDSDLTEMQKKAWDTQAQTRLALTEAVSSYDSVRKLNKSIPEAKAQIVKLEGEVNHAIAEQKKISGQITEFEKKLVETEKRIVSAKDLIQKRKADEGAKRNAFSELKKKKADSKLIKQADSVYQMARKDSRKAGDLLKYAEKDKGSIGRAIKNAKRSLDHMKRVQERREKDLQRSRDRLKNAEESLVKENGEWKEFVKKVVPLQKEALDLQKQVAKQLAEKINSFDTHKDAPNLARKFPDPITGAEVFKADMYELYTNADILEDLIVKEYKDIRAVDLSILRQMVFSAAQENIDTPKPVREKISRDILVGSPTTTTGLEVQKEAIKTALAEGDTMEEYCQGLLDSLMEQVEEEVTVEIEQDQQEQQQVEQVDMQQVQEQLTEEMKKELAKEIAKQMVQQIQQTSEKIEELKKKTEEAKIEEKAQKKETTEADEKVKEIVKKIEEITKELEKTEDLAKVEKIPEVIEESAKKLEEIAKLEKVAEEKSKKEKEEQKDQKEKEKIEKAEKKEKEAAEAAKEAAKQMKEVAKSMSQMMQQTAMQKQAMQKAAEMVKKEQMLAEASSGSIAKAADVSKLMKASAKDLTGTDLNSLVTKSASHPTLMTKTPGMEWGRIISSTEGETANWLLIDSWHSVGPWPNPNRVNRDRKFPPENSVDLDATYVGVDGKPIRWEFLQPTSRSHKAAMEPFVPMPYAIYYFYTELRSDKERDVWLATGSDDKSKIWVNDMLIWESAPYHKSWNIGEGYRKVHLKEGVNKILYRLENGWHGTRMSLGVYLGKGF